MNYSHRTPSQRLPLAGLLALAVMIMALCTLGPQALRAEPASVVRIAVLKYGTVNWELDVVRRHGLDKAAGIDLRITELASTQATKVALRAGTVDVVVTDWLWVTRDRSEGGDFTFSPYSAALGGLMVPSGSQVSSLSALEGRKVGIAGGPLDKSWLLLRAFGQDQQDIDLKAKTDQVFAAPPLLSEKLRQGEIDTALTYWHFAARLEAAGFRRLAGMQEVVQQLGGGNQLPMIGYVFGEGWARANPAAISGFLKATQEARQIMKTSNAEWETLRPLVRAKSEQELDVLRDRFREGIPAKSPRDYLDGAKRIYTVLARIGGAKLVGDAAELDPRTFWLPDKP